MATAATIAKLQIDMTARTAQLQSDMNHARNIFGGFESSVNSAKSIFLGFAAAFGAFQIKNLLVGTINAIDATATLAQQLGLTTAQLQSFRAAAEFGDVSVADLDKGLAMMSRQIGDAAQGTGEAGKALATLGLSAQQLQRIGMAEAFTAIAERVSGIQDPMLKASLAADIFGRSGMTLIPLLNAGKAGLDRGAEAAARFGTAFTEGAVKSTLDADDAMKSMKLAMKGMATQLTIAASPAVVNVADAITRLAVAMNSIDPTVARVAAGTLKWSTALAVAAFVAPRLVNGIFAIAKAMKALAAGQAIVQALSGPKGWATLAAGVAIAAGAVWGINKAFAASADAAGDAADDAAGDAAGARGSAAGARSGAFALTTPAADAGPSPIFDLLSDLDKVNREFGKTNTELVMMRLQLNGATQRAYELASAMLQVADQNEFAKGVQEFTDRLRDQIATMGVSQDRAELWRLTVKNSNTAWLEGAEALLAQVEAMQKHQAMIESGIRLAEQAKGPVETYMESIDALSAALTAGRITWDMYAAAIAKANETLEAQAGLKSAASAPDMRVAAREVRFTEGVPGFNGNPFSALEKTSRDQLSEQQKARRAIERSEALLRQRLPAVGASTNERTVTFDSL